MLGFFIGNYMLGMWLEFFFGKFVMEGVVVSYYLVIKDTIR
jgi:hypothetical protein